MTVLDERDLAGAEAGALRREIGDKAVDLVEFSDVVRRIGGRSTGFRVVTAEFVDEFQRGAGLDEGWAKSRSGHADVPGVEDVPADVRLWGAPFASAAASLLPDLPVVVRSSLVWPGMPGSRYPGVDKTAFLRSDADHDALGNVYTGLHKAYTDLCLTVALAGRPGPPLRRAGLILMEVVPTLAQGTAHLLDGRTLVEIARPGGHAAMADSPAALAATGVIPARTVDEVHGLLRQLDRGTATILEVEFVVHTDGHVNLIQRRHVEEPDNAGTPLFGGAGTFTGPVVDLRGLPRSPAARTTILRRLEATPGAVVVLPLRHTGFVDAFGLAWLLRHSPGSPTPGAVVATHDGGNQAGQPTHLRWTLRRTMAGSLFVTARDRDVPSGATSFAVESDGVTITVTPP